MKRARKAHGVGTWNLDQCTAAPRRRRKTAAAAAAAVRVNVPRAVAIETDRRADRLVALERQWEAAKAAGDREQSRALASQVGALRSALGISRAVPVALDYEAETWATRK